MITTILGLLFIFVIPGFLITNIIFPKEKKPEKIILTILLSISFYIFLSLILGFNEFTYKITGGLTEFNVWLYSVVINVILVVVYYVKRRKFQK